MAPTAADDGEGAAAPDPRIARAEERVALLRELAELGMALTRELTSRTLQASETSEAATAGDDAGAKTLPRSLPGPRHDPADSFARLSRAVRLSLALEAKADEELGALIAGDQARAAAAAAGHAASLSSKLPRDYPSAHRNRIRDHVFDAINGEITDIRPAQETLDILYERLLEGERYDAFIHRPMKETVKAICDDLGLTPDWSRWTDEGFPKPPEGAPRYDWEDMWAPMRARIEELRALDRREAVTTAAGP